MIIIQHRFIIRQEGILLSSSSTMPAAWRLQSLFLLLIPLCSKNVTTAFLRMTGGSLLHQRSAPIITSRSATVTPDMLRSSAPLRRKEINWPKLEDLTGSRSTPNTATTTSSKAVEQQQPQDVATVFREELPSLSIDSLSPKVFQQV